MALAIRNLYLLDGVLDARLDQIQECAVQVGMDGAVGIIVGGRAIPLAAFVDVLHQQPRSGAAIVIDAGRLALMDNDKVSGRTIYFDFNDAAHGQTAYGAAALIDEPGLTIYADVHLLHLPGLTAHAHIEFGHFVCRAPGTEIDAHAPTSLCVHQQDSACVESASHAGVGGLRLDRKAVDAGHAQGAVICHAEASANFYGA